MDQQKSKDWLPLLTAMAEGKKIQTRVYVDETNATCWINTNKVDVAYPVNYYRVAPELVQYTRWAVVDAVGGGIINNFYDVAHAERYKSMYYNDSKYPNVKVIKLEGSYER